VRWFFPQYNGDFRIISVDNSHYREQADDSACVLEIVDPTAHEALLLENFLADARKKKWTPVSKIVLDEVDGKRRQEILLSTSIASAGKLLYTRIRPADRTITAVTSTGGEVRVYETADLAQIDEALSPDAIIPAKDEEPEAPKEEPAAVSVKRPTPSCPQCIPGATSRASEVLQAFLTPLEHELWAQERFIIVEGGLSGHRYMLAHRHSRYAQKVGRICFDLDDDTVVHFHDNSVPPEEEVLAAKLILQHREPWLRNEATLFHGRATHVYKNPFGGVSDGVEEAGQTLGIGLAIKTLLDRT